MGFSGGFVDGGGEDEGSALFSRHVPSTPQDNDNGWGLVGDPPFNRIERPPLLLHRHYCVRLGMARTIMSRSDPERRMAGDTVE